MNRSIDTSDTDDDQSSHKNTDTKYLIIINTINYSFYDLFSMEIKCVK